MVSILSGVQCVELFSMHYVSYMKHTGFMYEFFYETRVTLMCNNAKWY